jgi:pullulanase
MDIMNQKKQFDSPEFEQQFHCDKPLGAFCDSAGTLFRLWAPTAESVILNLYSKGAGGKAEEKIALHRGAQGLWSYESTRHMDGLYYDYKVTVDGVTRRTADPYAKACGVNGLRSMVIDLERTNPEDWDKDKAPALPEETIIYEIHVKDFSWDASSGVKPEYRGKFKALCETGTTLNGDGVHPTCVDYLKELGVTYIQLMPSFDYGSVDEREGKGQFNWGYDPVNYNVPEGSYSTDPEHGEVRIREMKEAIQSLHRNGFRVIMDVVYNHTYQLDSWLWRTVPWYYYRQNENGTACEGSGCGNDLATERSMCAKYILDSVLYWAEEYHIDGFRFDLMGLLDVDLMNRIQRALDSRWGRGEKLIFGEPWSASTTNAREGTVLADKKGFFQLDETIGAFCDATRDAVKGKLVQAGALGFVNGGELTGEQLAHCVRGWANSGGEFSVQAPSQTITYLSSHDDWTLWDKLVYTMDESHSFTQLQPELLRANRLAAAMNFGCQGHLFMLSGEEFARTKEGVRDSFCSPVELNRMDWNRAWENHELVAYYQGFIALRKQLPGLQDKSKEAAKRILTVMELPGNAAAVELDNRGGNSPWETLVLAYSANKEETELSLPEGKWEVLADGVSSSHWQEPETVEGIVYLAPVSALILGQPKQEE